jgi:hypothetical protein
MGLWVAGTYGVAAFAKVLTTREGYGPPRLHSIPMQSHLGSVVLCLISTCMVGFKVLRKFYANRGESVQPLQSVKLIDQSCSQSRVAWTLT